MNAPIRICSSATPADRLLSRLNRDEIAEFIETAISMLDAADDDPDLEANGDELDGINSEDDFYPHNHSFSGPGCPLADDDTCSAAEDNLRLSARGLPLDEGDV